MTTPRETPPGVPGGARQHHRQHHHQRRRQWLVLAFVAAVVLLGAGAAVGVLTHDDAPTPPDPAVERAVAAIAASFTEGDDGVWFPPGYGGCVGAQTVEATGVQTLVDDGYLTADLRRAQPPGEVTTMSEGVATAWADARVECQDWEATAALLQTDRYGFSDAAVAGYADCMREMGGEEQRTALRQLATGVTGADVAGYRSDLASCAAELG